MSARKLLTILSLTRVAMGGMFDPKTSCPEGSKMTDFTYTFKDGGDLSKEFEFWSWEKDGSYEKEDIDFTCCIKIEADRLKIQPRHLPKMHNIGVTTKKTWGLPLYVALEGYHDPTNQRLPTHSAVMFEAWQIRKAGQFFRSTQDGVGTYGVNKERLETRKINVWSREKDVKYPDLLGKAFFSPSDALYQSESTRSYPEGDRLYFRGQGIDRTQWTQSLQWTPDEFVNGFLSPDKKANISITYKKTDSRENAWPLGLVTDGARGQALLLQGFFQKERPAWESDKDQSEAWALSRIQVSGCLFDGDGKIEYPLTWAPPPEPPKPVVSVSSSITTATATTTSVTTTTQTVSPTAPAGPAPSLPQGPPGGSLSASVSNNAAPPQLPPNSSTQPPPSSSQPTSSSPSSSSTAPRTITNSVQGSASPSPSPPPSDQGGAGHTLAAPWPTLAVAALLSLASLSLL